MNIRGINFDWVSRLSKVIFVFLAIISIPISYAIGSDSAWEGKMSSTLLYTALFLFLFYIVLILATKVILYIAKGENFLSSGFNKKNYFILTLPIVLFLITAFIFGVIVEPIQKNNEHKKVEVAYNQALLKIDSLKEQFRACATPVVNKKFSEDLRSCNLLKNKVKHDYNFCVSLYSINSPASCLYDNDYENIDCTTETIENKARSEVSEFDLIESCQTVYRELKDADAVIDKYKSLNK